MNPQEVCAILNRATLRAHRRFLRWARYAALAIPESYIQAECYISLGKKYGTTRNLILEPRLRQINFDNVGRNDLIIGDFSNYKNPNPELIIEFKRGVDIRSDIERIRQINHHHNSIGIISFYISRINPESLNNTVKILIKRHEIEEYYKTNPLPTKRRIRLLNNEYVEGKDAAFCNVCFVIR